MRFHTVYDLAEEQPRIVGVLFVGDNGQLAGAALEGSVDEPDSPYRVVRDLARETLTEIVEDGGQRVRRELIPGAPGFYEAVLHALRPPLAPGPRGNVTADAPSNMLTRVWDVVNPEAPLPPFVDMGYV